MFELSCALKYLKPRWRQLSSALISFISIFVIALVVWLNVVFFSVVKGMEEGWIHKLVALTAPLRITPTDAYYESYYHLVDTLANASDYREKTLAEKLTAETADPYDADIDPEVPESWHQDREVDGSLKDIVKVLFESIESSKFGNLKAEPYSLGAAQIVFPVGPDRELNQSVYLGSLPEKNPYLSRVLQRATFDTRGFFPVYLPKSFQKSGVLLRQEGKVQYRAMGGSGMQDQTLPVIVAGFYDPGMMSLGGRFILADKDLVNALSAFTTKETSGINVYTADLYNIGALKKSLEKTLEERGIAPYFEIASYEDYDFSRDLIQQLKSEQNLFFLLSLIILLVASSNILSLLIILVNDKRQEIGILRAMGASSLSIAGIFGLVGIVLGSLGSLLGLLFSSVTLYYLDNIIGFISQMQGRELFNPVFYGDVIPHNLSWEVVGTTLVVTALFSLIAGIIPALKASLVEPAEILRS